MCGIAAVLSESGKATPGVLRAITSAMSHRGPDRQGWWVRGDSQVGLGHARLSIIDLQTGQQPIENELGDVRITVNGEFYGFEEIRQRLQARGHRFRTHSDSEIAVHLYEDCGVELLHELRGEFAFALWDERKQLLIAARDRFGIKPLYYAVQDGTLYLASEVKALFAAGVRREWDPCGFGQQLFAFTHPDRTLFRSVQPLPPGNYLAADRSGIRVVRYWDLDYPQTSDPSERAPEEYAVCEVRRLLQESVRLRLRADVPVVYSLSGGIDSSAVLGIGVASAAQAGPAFTVAFEDTDFDESAVARRMAGSVGAEIHVVPAGGRVLAEHFSDAAYHAETLGVNLHGVARYALCRAIAVAGYKVSLTGEGADEVFGGYIHWRQDLCPKSVAEEPFHALEGVRARLGFVPAWIRKLAIERSIRHLFLSADYAHILSSIDLYGAFVDQFDANQRRGRPPLYQSMYLWTSSVLPNYILFAERLEMAHGVETRLPYLDHHLFEFVRRLSPDLLIRTAEKHVLREAVRPFVPHEICERGKQPFLAPPIHLSAGPMREFAGDVFHGRTLRESPFFDHAAVTEALATLPHIPPSQRASVESALLAVLCSCVLQDRMRLG
jgi:asparagine synthase (glutamine-hydrolysing)